MIASLWLREVFEIIFCYHWKLIKLKRRINKNRFLSSYFNFPSAHNNLKVTTLTKVNMMFLFSHSDGSDCLQPHGLQHASIPCLPPSPGACSNSCPLSWWCHPTIWSSVITFSSYHQSFPASGSFLMSPLFSSGGQISGASASASVCPMNTQDWSPLGWTVWISLQSKGLSRVFSNTTVQKYQFFSAQLSLWSSCHIHIWWLKNYSFD